MEVGEVAERSNATDCKSVALVASEVRILPSPPTLKTLVGKASDRKFEIIRAVSLRKVMAR